ncbi:MAG: MogA/MoaB family molybdenum cofactor biosynthesis protein [Bryobacteraceae bacterium]
MIRAAVITISDSSAAGTREDLSGPAICSRLAELGWEMPVREVLPDDAARISRCLANVADSGRVSLILTTGGTGLGPRDVTPEATRAVIEREIPGLAEWMRMKGRESTPRALLSRSLAGSRGQVLIVNLPGSPRGALESLDAIVNLVPHMLELLSGNTEHPAEQNG